MVGTSSSAQKRLRIGDIVLLYASGHQANGYLYHELSSSPFNFVSIFPKERVFPNVAFATFEIVSSIKEPAMKSSERSSREDEKIKQPIGLGTKVVYGDQIQLRHIGSKKFVCVSTQVSPTESNNLRVHLSKDKTSDCTFKILPHYKVWSEGDEVRYEERVNFECLRTPGQFLHCSDRKFDYNKFSDYDKFPPLQNHYELNLSAIGTAITPLLHYSPASRSSAVFKPLRSGCCIRLFHREQECYIIADGSFGNYPANPVMTNVHCRQRRMNKKSQVSPSSSATTYWQIENAYDPNSGSVLTWGEHCRIKHLPTRCYLAVIENKVTLVENSLEENKKNTLFSFHALIEEGEEVLLESYGRIRHDLNKKWLHLGNAITRKEYDGTSQGLESLQSDSAQLYQLSVSEEKGECDAFTLQEVSEELIDNFNYLAGVVPVLQQHVANLEVLTCSDTNPSEQQQGISPYRVHSRNVKWMLATLMEFGQWLNPVLKDVKNRQKLLRNLKVLELLVRTLKLYGKNQFKQTDEKGKEICRQCYNILTLYLKGDSRKNENFLAMYINTFQEQIGAKVDAEKVLVEIVQDNISIVTKMAETTMDYMIQQLIDTRDKRFLEFLGSLCVCNGKPIPSTQKKLLEDLVQDHGDSLFILTKCEEPNKVMYFSPSSTSDRKSLENLTNWKSLENLTESSEEKERFAFFEAQLYLFERLCKGNNKDAIERLSNRFLSFEIIYECCKSSTISPSLQSHYIELLLVMFVDVDDNQPYLDNLPYSFVYNNLDENPYEETGKDEAIALTGVRNEHFEEIKTWLLESIDVGEENEHNDKRTCQNPKILGQILEVMCHLINYGYYDSTKDVNDSMNALVKLLKSQNNCQSEADSDVINMKYRALKALHLFLKFTCYVHLQKFLYCFKCFEKQETTQFMSQETFHQLRQLRIQDEERFPRELTIILREQICQLSQDHKDKGFPFVAEHQFRESLVHTLLHLSQYDSNKLRKMALLILMKIHFFDKDLFNSAIQAQLLSAPPSIDEYEEKKKLLPQFHHYLSLDSAEAKLLEKLQELLPSSQSELNSQKQLMLCNLGIMSNILNYILHKDQSSFEVEYTKNQKPSQQPSSSSTSHRLTTKRKVHEHCFYILQALASRNKMVQKELFCHLGDFLNLKDNAHCIAELLQEIFNGRIELCLKVQEKDMKKIFDLMIGSKNKQIQAQFMVALQAIAKDEETGLLVRRNQHLIVQNFCQRREDLKLEHILKRSEEILSKPESSEHDPELSLLLSVTDLLATCAEGENAFIDSVCQNIYEVDTLLKIICSDTLSPKLKRPFLRFLIWVYMDEEEFKDGKKADTKTEIWISKLNLSKVWTFLDQTLVLLLSIERILTALPPEVEEPLKTHISSSRRHRVRCLSHIVSDQRLRALSVLHTIHTISKEGDLLPGVLSYFNEGIVPFLQTFFTRFFTSSCDPVQPRDETNIYNEIAKALMELNKVLPRYLDNEYHLLSYQELVCTMEKIFPDLEISGNVCFRGSNSTKRVDEEYQKQEVLNQHCNSFVEKYQEVYFGENTAAYQIGLSVSSDIGIKDYSDSDEELPLGPNFQSLLKCFSNRRKLSKDVICRGTSHLVSVQVYPECEVLLKQLEESFSSDEVLNEQEQKEQDVLDIRCLQVLRAIIHNQIKQLDLEEKERNGKKFRSHCKKIVEPVQCCIQKMENAILRVIPLLKHPNDQVAREVLIFMKVLLFGGNTVVQNGLEGLKQTREESLFITLRNMILQATHGYEESKDLDEQREKREKIKRPLSAPLAERKDERPYSAPLAECSFPSADSNPETTEEAVVVIVTDAKHSSTTCLLPTSQESMANKKHSKCTPKSKCTSQPSHDSSKDHYPNIRLVLEVIGLMCDGQRRTMQDYLREQPDNFKSVNVVAETVQLLETYTSRIIPENMDDIHQITQTLIEMSVGNEVNLQLIFDKHIMESLMDVLKYHDQSVCSSFDIKKTTAQIECKCNTSASESLENIVNMKGSVLELLDVMLEKTSQSIASVIQGIGEGISVDDIMDTATLFDHLKNIREIKNLKMDDDCERALFRAFHILVVLKEQKAIQVDLDINEEKSKWSWLQMGKTFSRSIEVSYKGNNNRTLTTVHFAYNPENELRNECKEKIKWQTNRNSMENKQRQLVELIEPMKRDIYHQEFLRGQKIFQSLLKFSTPRHHLLRFLTLLLNIIVLFAAKLPQGNDGTIELNPFIHSWFGEYEYILFILGSLHLFLSMWMVLEYFLINKPHFHLPCILYSALKFLCKRLSIEVNPPKPSCLDVNILGLGTLYMLIFISCSALSLAFHGYFYCICLLHIVVNNDILQRVLQAVTKNGTSLLMVAALGVSIFFIYSVVSFVFLREYFYPYGETTLYCETLLECFYTFLRYGLPDTIGLIIPLNYADDADNSAQDTRLLTFRLLFDLSFFIIVTTIGLNVVLGIIVDTFTELRNSRNKVEEDARSKCFVCDLPCHLLDRKGEGFEKHIREHHNMWNYVYYSVYLDSIDISDHNAIQKYVHDSIKDGSTDFLPQLEAISLPIEEDVVRIRLEELQGMVQVVLNKFQHKEYMKTMNAKKAAQQKWEEEVLSTK